MTEPHDLTSNTHVQFSGCAGCLVVIALLVCWAAIIAVGLRIIRWALG
jgi:hypothetical protein